MMSPVADIKLVHEVNGLMEIPQAALSVQSGQTVDRADEVNFLCDDTAIGTDDGRDSFGEALKARVLPFASAFEVGCKFIWAGAHRRDIARQFIDYGESGDFCQEAFAVQGDQFTFDEYLNGVQFGGVKFAVGSGCADQDGQRRAKQFADVAGIAGHGVANCTVNFSGLALDLDAVETPKENCRINQFSIIGDDVLDAIGSEGAQGPTFEAERGNQLTSFGGPHSMHRNAAACDGALCVLIFHDAESVSEVHIVRRFRNLKSGRLGVISVFSFIGLDDEVGKWDEVLSVKNDLWCRIVGAWCATEKQAEQPHGESPPPVVVPLHPKRVCGQRSNPVLLQMKDAA